eukprot:TRINITY_DN42709_c2_g1_i1.p2 TRINITY_DN42709_c2_g1~~TRINITY_DN42709_c2_g1_i1.p2  ORF type:complete len:241 (+),score=18.51 TRINITY_DN42709_c2_g1_i1:81-725(+)
MIMEVFKGSLFYIAMLGLIVYSFFMSFFTLFGKQIEKDENQGIARSLDSDYREFLNALTSVVSIAVGIYRPDDFADSRYWWLALPLLFTFIVITMVVLLNLLISVLGDAFQKSKRLEKARFMRARAEIMDDMENSLIFHTHTTQQYLHYLQPKLPEKSIEKQDWEGPMNTVIKHIRTIPSKTAEIVKGNFVEEVLEKVRQEIKLEKDEEKQKKS